MGLVLRALRRRRGWRQLDLAARAGCSQALVSYAEAGNLQGTSLQVVRSLFGALDARCDLAPRWRGAELEALIDEAHAAVVAVVAERLRAAGWEVAIEVTYSEFGERGSIDVLGLKRTERRALVVEVKTEIASAEAIGRRLDEKTRLAPRIIQRRWGWTPVVVGRAVVLPESPRLRRRVAATPALAIMFPGSARQLGRWLRRPSDAVSALWFLSPSTPRNGRRVAAPARRAQAGPGADLAAGKGGRDICR